MKDDDNIIGPWNPPKPKEDYAIVEYKDRCFLLLDSNGKPIRQGMPRIYHRPKTDLGLTVFRTESRAYGRRKARIKRYEFEFMSEGEWIMAILALALAVSAAAYYTTKWWLG